MNVSLYCFYPFFYTDHTLSPHLLNSIEKESGNNASITKQYCPPELGDLLHSKFYWPNEASSKTDAMLPGGKGAFHYSSASHTL